MLKLVSISTLSAVMVLLMTAGSAFAVNYQAVAEGSADASGSGALQFDVGDGDPQAMAAKIQNELLLTHEATIQTVTVQNGVATVWYSGAPAGALVTGALPEGTILALGATAGVGGATATTSTTAGLIGAGVLVGGVVGGAAIATDGFQSDADPPEGGEVASPSQ